MRLLLASVVVGWTLVGALQGCSSSSSPASPGADAGAHDATAADGGGGGHDAGSIDASPSGDAAVDSPVADGAPVDVVAPEEAATPEAGGTDAGTDTGSDAMDAGVPEDCGSTPTLHADEAGTIFCGFTDASLDCVTGQECCLGGYLVDSGSFAAQACATWGSTCKNGVYGNDAAAAPIAIACAQVADCNANGVTKSVACCLQGATAPVDEPTCTYPKSTLGSAIVCESSDAGGAGVPACPTGEVQICSSPADCPTGKTCTAGKWKILQVGFCL
ncbi:MAG: hypothetical protein ABSE49_05725 [Polyangiaceae bacterium]|jgi:hypothetical protein